MKIRTIAIAAVAAGLVVHAAAQNTPADGKSAAAAQDTQRPATAAADPDTYAPSDPRRCLAFSTNIEVHTCAEKYRPRKRNG